MYSLALSFESESYYDSAFYWYSKAASLGENLSMHRLAKFYIEGAFVEKDFKKGWDWLQKAAEIDRALAYLEMANIFYHGNGVRVDKAKALEYYKEAAANGSRVAGMYVRDLKKELGR
jgi:TPR repeat protein